MTFIKQLNMEGFKSFAKRTEVPFDKKLSVILGPNGSGKSNISDAICFVLGRLSAKSMRASNAANLIHNGGKAGNASDEAMVEMVFDNSGRIFSLNQDEVRVSRTVRKTGNSIYKINNETKTRQEILELLAQAGIDPNGFNIILQEEISKFVKMHPEERRQIVEQVAGISVYEEKKHKSLLELNRTDEKIKEVRTILNERSSYLKNLDQERKEALSYDSISKSIVRDKAALLFRQVEDKTKEAEKVKTSLQDRGEYIAKSKLILDELEVEKAGSAEEVSEVDRSIEQATGVEQDKLHQQVTESKVKVNTLSVRLENFTQQLAENIKKKDQLERDMQKNIGDIQIIRESLPKEDVKKQIGSKTEAFSSLEEKKARLDKLRVELVGVKNNVQSKKYHQSYLSDMITSIHNKITELSKNIPEETESIEGVQKKLKSISSELVSLEEKKVNLADIISGSRREISLIEKIKRDIKELDSCPVCLRKVSKDHVEKVHEKSDADLAKLKKKLADSSEDFTKSDTRISEIKLEIDALNKTENRLKIFFVNKKNLDEKVAERRKFEQERKLATDELTLFEKRASTLEVEISKYLNIEKLYNELKEELKDMTKVRDEHETMIMDLNIKERDIESIKVLIKKGHSDKSELEKNIFEIEHELKTKQKILRENEERERSIQESFQKLFKKKTAMQQRFNEADQKLMENKLRLRSMEDELNMLKINRARVDAELETANAEFEQYKNLDIESLKLKQSKHEIESRIKKNEESLIRIGSVNLKALEVYDKVKEEYDKINEKVATLEGEKLEILSIISSIDRKKKNSFLKVFDALNQGFSKNMFALAGKDAFLSLENKTDPFDGGVNIDVRLGKGKYLDVSSLSGGERTMAALSLIFAIQELRPYYFYIFDEIDAALDKRNSERLGSLLKTYIKNAQYIVITHNDSLISEAPVLFGVSMQEGKSKVLSLKVGQSLN